MSPGAAIQQYAPSARTERLTIIALLLVAIAHLGPTTAPAILAIAAGVLAALHLINDWGWL